MMHRASTLKARRLRKIPTPYETMLWKLLRDRQMEGIKFRRQHPVGPYVADFACVEGKLVIELDGRVHDTQQEYDAARDHFLREQGWTVLRFSNAGHHTENRRCMVRHKERVVN